jgi:hypothetical protein
VSIDTDFADIQQTIMCRKSKKAVGIVVGSFFTEFVFLLSNDVECNTTILSEIVICCVE